MKLINTKEPIKHKKHVSSPVIESTTVCFCLMILFFSTQSLYARTTQPIEGIHQAAKKFLEEMYLSADNPNVEIMVGKVDPRLRLTQCEQDLEVYLPQGVRKNGKTSVGVKCQGRINWKIIVPAEIRQYELAWVVNKSLSTTDLVSSHDVNQRRVMVNHTRRVPLLKLKKMLNTNPKKSMRSGSIVYQDSVCLVCRGDKVSVSANSQFLSINVEGIALNDAILGEEVQIKNTQSKKVFGAIVIGKNQLSVNIASSR